ncbi:MAG: hypothetical protein ACM3X6_04640 [Patescibacteria group bacterium]
MVRLLACLLCVLAIAAAGCGPGVPAAASARVEVDLGAIGRAFEPRLRGVMVGSWENPASLSIMAAHWRDAEVTFLEFPGGLEASDGSYDWQASRPSQIGPDQFAALADAAGAAVRMCIADYGANDPAKAAAWVAANRECGWGAAYWEVGDEEYGAWAGHAAPGEYAARFRAYHQAMKAADPAIKVGAPVTVYDPWWTRTVLAYIGDIVDWVALSYYPQDPGGESDAALLAAPGCLGGLIADLRQWLAEAAPGRKVEIIITGWGSVSYNPGPQTLSAVNGLFTADAIGAMAAAGVDAAGLFCSQMDVLSTGGTYGLFGTGADPGAARPAYWGLKAWAGAAGNLVACASDAPELSCRAVAGANGILLVLINRDPARRFTADIALAGYAPPAGWMTVSLYGRDQPVLAETARRAPAAEFCLDVPPHTLAVVHMPG